MKDLLFIADYFVENVFGGAEIVDKEIIEGLEKSGYIVHKLKCADLNEEILSKIVNDKPKVLIGNFGHLQPEAMNILANHCQYSIIEHDHKYLQSRNVAIYKDCLVPPNEIINRKFYANANNVFCQADSHAKLVSKNLGIETINLSTSIWSDLDLDIMEKHCSKPKNGKTMVLGSNNPIKNTKVAQSVCEANGIDYDTVGPLPYPELMSKMAEYSEVLFLPTWQESFNRFIVEAKMLGCRVKTNNRNGATSEPWFKDLSGIELINFIRNSKKEFISKLINPNDYVPFSGKQNHFKIIIPLYNTEKWIDQTLDTVMGQTYSNFQCIIMDDMSTDNSNSIIKEKIKGDPRFKLVSNSKKAYALKNIHDAINISKPGDEDIIITLDGDDWLANSNVLSMLNFAYNTNDCWLTYGSYVEYPSGNVGVFAREVAKEVQINGSYRKSPWCFSHLRTFKYHLWNKINTKDLLDRDGNFYRMAWDLAFMFPMLEMSGAKSLYLDDIAYVYNLSNPINDHKIDHNLQMKFESEIRNKNPYSLQKEV